LSAHPDSRGFLKKKTNPATCQIGNPTWEVECMETKGKIKIKKLKRLKRTCST
jgi:hypothetical protein